MQEQLTREFREREARANGAAVEYDRRGPRGDGLAPFGKHLAFGIEQQQPERERRRAVSRPIIRGDEPRMQAGLIAEEHEVSGEVDRIEIASAIREKRVRKTNLGESR